MRTHVISLIPFEAVHADELGRATGQQVDFCELLRLEEISVAASIVADGKIIACVGVTIDDNTEIGKIGVLWLTTSYLEEYYIDVVRTLKTFLSATAQGNGLELIGLGLYEEQSTIDRQFAEDLGFKYEGIALNCKPDGKTRTIMTGFKKTAKEEWQ